MRRRPVDPRDPDGLVASWADPSAPPLSEHIRKEIAVAHWRGRPLDPAAPVPGCTCETCTGTPAPTPRRRRKRDHRPALDVDRARAVPITDVAHRLGIEVNRHWALCPFHSDSSPSLHVNPKKNRAFCNPCGRSWDGIALMMELGNMTFTEAVKELAA